MNELNKRAEKAYVELFEACLAEEFAGHDPFDGLSSDIFQAIPFTSKFTVSRLVWLQFVKRSPLNLRKVLLVPKEVNPKGLGLFLSSEVMRFRSTSDRPHLEHAENLAGRLKEALVRTENGFAWGYPFDWQSRAFFAPRKTPTIVPTVFAANGLLDLYGETLDEEILQIGRRVGDFIINDLNRPHDNSDELCFSYTPIDNSVILNASLLAAELLARLDAVSKTDDYSDLVRRSINFVISLQNEDGSWSYGPKLRHSWIDNFHTAFILVSLLRISENTSLDLSDEIGRGFDYWCQSFFEKNGAPKYFNNSLFPIDVHSCAAAVHGLSELSSVYPEAFDLAERVLGWTLENMRAEGGRFKYQKRRFFDLNHQFTRWNDAWMAYAISTYLLMRND